MKKTLTIIAATLIAFTASCSYSTSYSSKGGCVPVVQPASVVVQPVVRPVYIEQVVRPIHVRPIVYSPYIRYSCYDY